MSTFLTLFYKLCEDYPEVVEFDNLFSVELFLLNKSRNFESDFKLLSKKIKEYNNTIEIENLKRKDFENDYYTIRYKVDSSAYLIAQFSLNKETLNFSYFFTKNNAESNSNSSIDLAGYQYNFELQLFMTSELPLFENNSFYKKINEIFKDGYSVDTMYFYTHFSRALIKHEKSDSLIMITCNEDKPRIMIDNLDFLGKEYLIEGNTLQDSLQEFKDILDLNLEY